jgi:hypothetical protein
VDAARRREAAREGEGGELRAARASRFDDKTRGRIRNVWRDCRDDRPVEVRGDLAVDVSTTALNVELASMSFATPQGKNSTSDFGSELMTEQLAPGEHQSSDAMI